MGTGQNLGPLVSDRFISLKPPLKEASNPSLYDFAWKRVSIE